MYEDWYRASVNLNLRAGTPTTRRCGSTCGSARPRPVRAAAVWWSWTRWSSTATSRAGWGGPQSSRHDGLRGYGLSGRTGAAPVRRRPRPPPRPGVAERALRDVFGDEPAWRPYCSVVEVELCAGCPELVARCSIRASRQTRRSMCGRVTSSQPREAIAERFRVAVLEAYGRSAMTSPTGRRRSLRCSNLSPTARCTEARSVTTRSGLVPSSAGVPEGSCTGTAAQPLPASLSRDSAARETGVCPDCGGRFRLAADGLLPNHAPARRGPRQLGDLQRGDLAAPVGERAGSTTEAPAPNRPPSSSVPTCRPPVSCRPLCPPGRRPRTRGHTGRDRAGVTLGFS